MAIDLSAPFVWGDGGQATTPEEIARRRKLAQALLDRGGDFSPVQHWTQGAARVASALGGAMQMKYAADDEKASRDEATKEFNGLLGGAPAASPGTVASTPAMGTRTASAPADLAPIFDEASRATGIPAPVLIAKVKQESSFNPNATGGAGEIGLAQILPSTARQPGFGLQGVDPASLRDPKTNIMFGAQYLAARGKAAGIKDWNDPTQVARGLTAYNGGGDPNYASNVMRYMPGKGAPIAGGGGQETLAGGSDTIGAPASAGAANVAQAMRVLNNPYSSAGQKAVAQAIIQRGMKDPTEAELRSLQIQKAREDLATAPLDREGKALSNKKAARELERTGVTGDQDNYNFYAKQEQAAGRQPLGFNEWTLAQKRATASNMTIDQRAEGEFEKGNAKAQSEALNEFVKDGVSARSDVGQIKRLREELAKLPGGMIGGVQAFANRFGVKIGENAGAIEAADAIISRLVPAQRQGMPGAASDRDVELFRAALPKLSNTPEGNKIILDTMEALATHRLAMADIARKATTNRMSRAEAMDALYALPDPFEAFKGAVGGRPAGVSPAPGAPAAIDTSKPGNFVFNPATGRMEPTP